MNTSERAVAFDGTYYSVVKGTGRRWLVVDKFSGAVVDEGIRSCAVMFASAMDTLKTRREGVR